MANTFNVIYLHTVFAVKHRYGLLPPHIQPSVHAYLAESLRQLKQRPIIVGGVNDHVHLLYGYNPTVYFPDMIRDIKTATSKFINRQHLIPFKFVWQAGYGTFSYSESQVEAVKAYIRRQPEHHINTSFIDEYKSILEKFKVEFKDEYIFHEPLDGFPE